MIESPGSPRPIPSLHWLAEEKGLEPTHQIGQGRMRCPYGCDAHKPKGELAGSADFSTTQWSCHICGEVGNVFTLTKYYGLNSNSIPPKRLEANSIQNKQYQRIDLDSVWEELQTLNDLELVKKWAMETRGFPESVSEQISKLGEITRIGLSNSDGDTRKIINRARWKDRLFQLPIRDNKGKIISIEQRWHGVGKPNDSRPKAMALPGDMCPEKSPGTPRMFGSLPEAIETAKNSTLYLVEGSMDYLAVRGLVEQPSVIGVCSASEMPKVAKAIVEQIKGQSTPPAQVIIFPHYGDTNNVGEESAKKAAGILAQVTRVKIVELPRQLGIERDFADCLRELGIHGAWQVIIEAKEPNYLLKRTPIFEVEIPNVCIFRATAKKLILEWIQFARKNPELVNIIGTTPGAGKSTMTAIELVNIIDREDNPPKIIFVCSTHAQLQQADKVFKKKGVKTIRTMGKKRFRDTGECKKAQELEIRESLGISTSSACNECLKGPKSDFKDRCEYQKGLSRVKSAGPGDVVLMVTDQIYRLQWHKDFLNIDENTLIVFDECPCHGFAPTKTISQDRVDDEGKEAENSLFHRDKWPEPGMIFAEIFYQLLDSEPKKYLNSKNKHLKKWGDTTASQELQGISLRSAFGAIAVKVLAKYKLGRSYKAFLETVANLEPGKNAKPKDNKVTHKSMPAWIPETARLILYEPHRLVIQRAKSTKADRRAGTLTIFEKAYFRQTNDEGESIYTRLPSVLILDAHVDSNLENWKRFLPDYKLNVKKYKIPIDPKKVEVQLINLKTSQAAIGDDDEHFCKLIEYVKRVIESMGGKIVIYVNKKNKVKVKKALEGYENVEFDHFGRTRGSNKHRGKNIIILGEANRNENAVRRSLYAMTGKEPSPKQVKEQMELERYRELYEAVYRSRPLDSPEEGLNILIITQDRLNSKLIQNLIYGAEVELLRDFREQDLLDLLGAKLSENGWIPKYNLFAEKIDENLNDSSRIRNPVIKYTLLYGFEHPIEIAREIPEKPCQSLFGEIQHGTRSFCLTDGDGCSRSVSVLKTLSPEQATRLELFCSDHGLQPSKSFFNFLAEKKASLSEVVQESTDGRTTTACMVSRDVEEVSTTDVDNSWESSKLEASDVVPQDEADFVSRWESSEPADQYFPEEKVIFVPSQELYSLQI